MSLSPIQKARSLLKPVPTTQKKGQDQALKKTNSAGSNDNDNNGGLTISNSKISNNTNANNTYT